MSLQAETGTRIKQVALIEAGSPGLNIYSHVAMGRGVTVLASVVNNAGYSVKAFIEDVSGKDSIDWDYVKEAQVIGFSSITCTLPRTALLIEKARQANPSAVIVLGGPEPTCNPERSLRLGVDYVVRGEGEQVILEFLEALESGPISDIRGVSWLEDGVVHNCERSVQLTKEAVNKLPITDHSLVHKAEKCTVGSVWRSRGCPQRCDFCEVWQIWPRYVVREDEQAVQEAMNAQETGRPVVFLIDDNAAGNKTSFKQFLRMAIDAGFMRHLVVQLRADVVFNKDGSVDRELLKLLKKVAASTIVCVGVESADDGNLDDMHKNIDSKTMARALKIMRRYGLIIHGMLIALANDTLETIRKNGDFAIRYLSTLQYLFETPLPGTIKTAQHEAEDRIMFTDLKDLSYYDGMHITLRSDNTDPIEMQNAVIREYRRFYSAGRVAKAFITGLLFRFRFLNPGQKQYLRQLVLGKRLYWWLRFHLEYKLVQWSLLAVGRRRVRDFLKDPAFSEYRMRLGSMS
ncbi:MAG TPA: radical SAM protein [Candidatus Aquicultor sp.]|jgi:anaerobic magnesium-protoporphyrin IX monomethyl ester cyclase